MALDGLSNQSVGIYRNNDSSEKTERMAAKYKEKAEFHLSNIEETTAIDKVNDEPKKEKDKNDEATKELILSKATQLVEGEESEPLQVVIEDEENTQELTYTMQFNTKTQLIEMKNDKTNELIETIKPEDLMKVLSKAKSIAGILVDSQI